MTTVGVLGAGQLGRMLALAGIPLGLRFRFLDPARESPAGQVAEHICGDYADPAALAQFACGLDVVTYEFENVPVETVCSLAAAVPVYPPPHALAAAQDRLSEKTLFRSLGIPAPEFAAVSTEEQLQAAVERIGLPSVLKTRRMGYDGKGQAVLREPSDIAPAFARLGAQPLLLEGFVPFDREVSVIAVRSVRGETVCYPLVENVHREGILRMSTAPAADVAPGIQAQAERCARLVLDALDYVGVLAIELFDVGGTLYSSEMAPRVHNSAHWTIEGAETSQFENHLRAILDLPLGSTAARGHSRMFNLIGSTPDPSDVLAVPGAHLHVYGKSARPGRKLGHVTLRADGQETLERGTVELKRLAQV